MEKRQAALEDRWPYLEQDRWPYLKQVLNITMASNKIGITADHFDGLNF